MTVLSIGDDTRHYRTVGTPLGDYIKASRESLGLNQTELAERATLNRAHLSEIERGKIAFPNADIRRRLATALGVSHLDLLVAAREITREEIGTSVGVVVIDPTDPKARLHAAIDNTPMSDDRINGLIAMLQTWSESTRRRSR